MKNGIFPAFRQVLLCGCIAVLPALFAGCDGKPPSWESLLAAKVTEQYPTYSVSSAPGQLMVTRPGLASQVVDVREITIMCQRGPRDCEYATSDMLMALRPPAAAASAGAGN